MRTLKSPIQAVTTLLRTADGTVEAELVLISTEKPIHEFVQDAQNVRLRMPDGEMVALEQSEPGHYRGNSNQNPELVYESGQTYQFRFELSPITAHEGTQERGPGRYFAVTKTPAEEVEFSWEKKPAFAGDTAQLTWKPRSLKAIVVVRNEEGEVRYSTFDFSDPQFGGDKWARLGSNGRLALGVDVFSEPGEYQVVKYGVTKNSALDPEMSADLGILSGFLAGTCEEIETLKIHE